MLFLRMVCKIPEVILRRSLANSRDTSCHRSVIAATQHPGILAAWISPHYTLNFKVLRGKYCGHHTRPPYILRGQKFSLSVIFENLGAKPAHPRLSLLFYFSHGLHQYGGQEFSLTTSSFLSFSKISVQNQLIFAFLFPFCSVSSTIL